MVNLVPRECGIGSRSELKIGAAADACARLTFPVKLHGVRAESGVSHQPIGRKKMLEGALNRIEYTKGQLKHFSLYFAAESGMEEVEGRWYDVVCGVVHNARTDQTSIAFSASFPLPLWVADMTLGLNSELGEVVKRLSGNTLKEKDAIAYFTRFRLNRREQVMQAFLYALPPILCSDLYEKGA